MSTAEAMPRDPGPDTFLRRHSWLAVLVGGALAYLLVLRTLVRTENPNFIPSLILLGSIVVPMAVLLFAATGRGNATAPVLVVLTAVAGGVIGTVAAGTLEYDTLQRLKSLPMAMVAVIEETAKLLVPVALLLAVRRTQRAAGVVIGVASGMGFACLETMGYAFSALLSKGNLAAVDQTLLLRGLLSPAGHVAWTGVTVAALWHIPAARRKGRAVGLAVGAFLGAVLLHTAWDGSTNLIVHVVVAALSVTALLLVIRRSHRHERDTQLGSHPVPAR